LSVAERSPPVAATVYVVLTVVNTRGPLTAKFHVVNPETAGEIVSVVGAPAAIVHPPVIVTPFISILFL
jgi:hypothetical protein